MVIVFIVLNLDIRLSYWRAYGINVQAINVYVAPHNIECYIFHNYGHTTHDCRSMMDISLRKNKNISYNKV
jgi:hypothetical protein